MKAHESAWGNITWWYADLILFSEHRMHFAGWVSGLYFPYLKKALLAASY